MGGLGAGLPRGLPTVAAAVAVGRVPQLCVKLFAIDGGGGACPVGGIRTPVAVMLGDDVAEADCSGGCVGDVGCCVCCACCCWCCCC